MTTTNTALEEAVIGVLGIDDIVRRTETLCVETLPTSFGRYGAAVEDWGRRNAALVARARRVLASGFPDDVRPTIEAGIRSKNDGLFAPIMAAAAAQRIAWCDESFAAMAAGTMDVYDNENWTGPLLAPR